MHAEESELSIDKRAENRSCTTVCINEQKRKIGGGYIHTCAGEVR